MKHKIVFLLAFFSMGLIFNIAAQDAPRDSILKIAFLQYKIETLENRIEDLVLHNKDLSDARLSEVEKMMAQKEEAIDARMLIYVSIFVAAFLIVIGFFRWLGKSEIRKIVTEQAIKQTDEQLKIKLSDAVIDEKLTLLGKPIIEQMLNEIAESKERVKITTEALEESSRKYQQLLKELSAHSSSAISEPTIEDKKKVETFTQVLDIVKEEEDFTDKDWHLKGMEAYNKSNYTEAEEYLTRSIRINPDNERSYYYRGLTKYRNGKYKESIEDFNKSGDQWHVLFIRASAYYYSENYAKALEDIENALKLNPKDSSALRVKREVLAKMK